MKRDLDVFLKYRLLGIVHAVLFGGVVVARGFIAENGIVVIGGLIMAAVFIRVFESVGEKRAEVAYRRQSNGN